MEAYSYMGSNYGFPYRILVRMPVTKKFKGKLTMALVSPWCGCLPKSMALLTMFQDASFFSEQILNQPGDISPYALEKINLGQVGNANNGPTNHSWDLNLTQPFNSFIFEIYSSWGSACRSGSNSVWITSINFITEDAPQAVGVPLIPVPIQLLKTKNWLSFTTSKLLYSARVNGWSPSTFHSLCDGKGPTVSIAYINDGRFIGGFNPDSWSSNHAWRNSTSVFLFDSNDKYPATYGTWGDGVNSTYTGSSYFPAFGGGHDFYTNGASYFYNNAYTFVNSSRQGPLGNGFQQLRTYTLSNLEVYSVDAASMSWTFSYHYGVYSGTSVPTQKSLSDDFWDRSDSVWGSASANTHNYIMATFENVMRIRSITVGPISPNYGGWGWNYLNGATLQYSPDGSNWYNAISYISQSNTSEKTITYSVDFNARYVRIKYFDNQNRWLGVGTFTFQ